MSAVLVSGPTDRYAELAVSSPVEAETDASTHCTDPRRMAKLSAPAKGGHQSEY